MQDRGPAAYFADFVGTLLLVFFITAVVSLYGPEPSPQNTNPLIDFGVIGLVHVLLLFVLIQTLAVISGAHFDPAVTVAMVALRQIKPSDAVIYILVQLAGGLAGAGLTKLILVDEGASESYGAPALSSALEGKILVGMAVEALGTFFLVWAIIGVAVNPQAAKDWAAFAVGGALGMAVMVLGPLTGGAFNPAGSLGPAVWGDAFHGVDTFVLVYAIAPLLGALAATVLYSQVFIATGKKGAGGAAPVG